MFNFNEFKKPEASAILDTGSRLIKEGIADFKAGALGFMKGIRSRTIPGDGEPNDIALAEANWATDPGGKDWRVKLSIPNISSFNNSALIGQLKKTGGLCFPYTPTIIMSHQASYNALQPVHSNYPFFAYENSSVDAMTLTGQFYAQNALEGAYWLGALHYLRSVTKMFYGASSNQGAPPPVVKLNGYGDYVFKNVPVIITNFTIDMPTEVDYIAVNLATLEQNLKQLPQEVKTNPTEQGQIAYVPVESQVTVTIQPIYSRSEVEKFSLDKFVKGNYIGPNGKGFI